MLPVVDLYFIFSYFLANLFQPLFSVWLLSNSCKDFNILLQQVKNMINYK